MRRKVWWLWVAFGLAFVAGGVVGWLEVEAGPVAVIEIDVLDNVFDRDYVEILEGQTVRWVNKGFNEHNVVAKFGSFNSGAPSDQPWTYEVTFNNPGTFEYLCEPHLDVDMIGTIVVKPVLRSFLPLLRTP